MAIKNGHFFRLYLDGTAIGNATSCSWSLNKDMREISHKDTAGSGAGYKEFLPGEKSGTAQTENLYEEAETSFEAIWTAFDDDSTVTVRFSDETSGNKYFEATAYIVSLEKNAPNNDNVSYSAQFQLTGAVTRGTVA